MTDPKPRPPLPSSTVWDCLRIPGQFYVEWLAGYLALAALAIFLEKQMGQGAALATIIFGVTLTLALLVRMVRKVINLRNAKGPMRGNGLFAFWLVLLLPVIALGALFKLAGKRSQIYERQEEARVALGTLAQEEKKFHGEFGKYTASIKDLEYEVDPAVPRHYMIGFPTSCAIKEGVSAERAQWSVSEAPIAEARKLELAEYFLKVRNPEDCKPLKEGFEIYAAGVVKEGAKLDVWRIDEKGKLENLQVGDSK